MKSSAHNLSLVRQPVLPPLADLTNEALIESLRSMRTIENRLVADLVLYLYEVDTRKVYLDLGYSSLFSFCTKALGYSDGSAYRRTQAAKVLKDNPEVYDLLREGKISLCAVTEVSKIAESKSEVIALALGKSKLEVQKIAAKYRPLTVEHKRDSVKVTAVQSAALPLFDLHSEDLPTKASYTLTIQVDEDFMALLENAKCKVGPAKIGEVLKRALKTFVQVKPARTPKILRATKGIRYIPRIVRQQVRDRDNHQCSFISPDGHRCCEKRGLEIDHIIPFSQGGRNDLKNLRLMCRAHNQFLAEKVMGKEFVMQKRERQSCSS